MQEINIKLCHNHDSADWSIEINGLLHEHVSAREMEDLVEAAMIVAEKSLMGAEQGERIRSGIISERKAPSKKVLEFETPQEVIDAQLENLIRQVFASNDELAAALTRLRDSWKHILKGEAITDAGALLEQADTALENAQKPRNFI
jgi:Asp-tRNA(Asn)/Glu-tRNA(Gln) amidotransferase B subunit